ncbi:hypothetical protein C3B61_03400 [Cryobacterium zongtaii]|uniref:Uncharacterized protein n=1 Tax=Cryobacterium zongtaii TaxID=1259217 RepID=A0A2S3ZKV7_9MICO|nr:hypothetical protein [Cryobacterium zongtaii]POH68959.1 hypothetical protein C3B61_03400 [Cryobacterium zongtaii]
MISESITEAAIITTASVFQSVDAPTASADSPDARFEPDHITIAARVGDILEAEQDEERVLMLSQGLY